MTGKQDFWSRRRAQVAAEQDAERAALETEALAEQHATLEAQSDEDILASLDLPDPDTMKMGDDFSVFMAKAVPDRIRRRALRTLWRSNPVLANLDQLVDYGEDFTDSAMVIENLQTTYQVGKGMLKHVQEMARQAEETALAENDETAEPDIEPPVADDAALVAEADSEAPLEDVETDGPEEEQVTVDYTPPRRMKFRIEETA